MGKVEMKNTWLSLWESWHDAAVTERGTLSGFAMLSHLPQRGRQGERYIT